MGYMTYTNTRTSPRNQQRRTLPSMLENMLTYTMKIIKAAMAYRMISLGRPSQILVLDSRSYFFMTSSTSAAVPTSTSTGDVSTVCFSFSSTVALLLYRAH